MPVLKPNLRLVLGRSPARFPLTMALIVVVLILAGCASGRGARHDQTIRVMTWNIHHAEGTDGIIDVDRIAKLIVREKVDIVALQEIDRGVQRSKKIDIITTLADLTDLTYAFGKTIDYQGGEYGNGFLTRLPILEESNTLYKSSHGKEQRGVLVLVLDFKGQEFVVANTHLDSGSDDSARVATVEELTNRLRQSESRPAILFGDFNDIPGSRTIGTLKNFFADTWEFSGTGNGFTFPSTNPNKRIDYIFTRKDQKPDSVSTLSRLRPLSARVVSAGASDHLPVIVELTFSNER